MTRRPLRFTRNLTDPISGFQVLGERNSGTNFVAKLLADNLDQVTEREIYGWKHGFIDRRLSPDPGLLTVLVYRHPLRWLQSVHQKPLHLTRTMSRLSFGDFLRHPWHGAFDDGQGEETLSIPDTDPKTHQPFSNPMRARSAKIAYFEEMAEMPARVAYLRFEDVNRDPRGTLTQLARAFDIPLRPYSAVAGFKGQQRQAYVPKRMPRVPPQDMAFIAAELDPRLEAQIGYQLHAPPQFDGLPAWDTRALRSVARSLSSRSGGNGRRGRG